MAITPYIDWFFFFSITRDRDSAQTSLTLFPLLAFPYIGFIFMKTLHVKAKMAPRYSSFTIISGESASFMVTLKEKNSKRRSYSCPECLCKLITQAWEMDILPSLSPVPIPGAVNGISPMRKGVLERRSEHFIQGKGIK